VKSAEKPYNDAQVEPAKAFSSHFTSSSPAAGLARTVSAPSFAIAWKETAEAARAIGAAIVVERADLVFLNPEPNEISRDVMALSQPVRCLFGMTKLLSKPFSLSAWSKKSRSGQITAGGDLAPRDPKTR
jgi:hypothetical protein